LSLRTNMQSKKLIRSRKDLNSRGYSSQWKRWIEGRVYCGERMEKLDFAIVASRLSALHRTPYRYIGTVPFLSDCNHKDEFLTRKKWISAFWDHKKKKKRVLKKGLNLPQESDHHYLNEWNGGWAVWAIFFCSESWQISDINDVNFSRDIITQHLSLESIQIQ